MAARISAISANSSERWTRSEQHAKTNEQSAWEGAIVSKLKSPEAEGFDGMSWPSAKRAGNFIFVGGHTPHDLKSGRLVMSASDLPAEQQNMRAPVLFTEVAAGRLRAQTWQVLQNLKTTLDRMGSSIEHVAHLRIFLREIAHEGVVLDLVKACFGASLCSGEIIEARNVGSHASMLVQMDCVALATAMGSPQHLWTIGLERLSDPFPTATRAGGLLFSSQIAGAHSQSGEAFTHERELSSRARQLLGSLPQRAARRSLSFFVQQAAMWDHLLSILDDSGIDHKATLYHMNWMRRPMSIFIDGSVTRGIMSHTGDYLLTCFPASGVRTPGAELEGRIVAILGESGLTKDVRVPIHGISNSYFGAIKVGPYLFAAGEVPIDTDAWALVDRAELLSPPRNRGPFGKPYDEAPIQAQANYIYALYQKTFAAYGVDLTEAVHQSIYLTDASDGPAIEGVVSDHFGDSPPATTIVPIIGASPYEAARLELELTAYIGD
jgi:enamine deaminase RidA (YjgF/YER057c/UK114 family)